MVKELDQTDKEAIARAVAEAERTTCAELVCVVAPASAGYQYYVFLYGFITGSTLALLLWGARAVTSYPLLLMMQLGVITAVSLMPWLRHLCLRLVPRHIQHRRAAHRAFEEYLVLSRYVAADTPIVLLYVSVAERYAHILPSRLVRDAIPSKAWDDIIAGLTAAVPASGVRNACIGAIERASALMAEFFPKT